jgi:phosphoenolpyruvate phosphomutase
MVQRNIEIENETWTKLKLEAIKKSKNLRELAGEIIESHFNNQQQEIVTKPKAIILAAGEENRLKPLTDDFPTCMININGKTLLERLLEAFMRHGIKDISIVKGYKKSAIKYPKMKYYYNKNYKKNKTLESLFYAEPEISGELLVSYSDIWVDDSIIKKLLDSDEDISIVVDTDWKKRYDDRYHHPIEEAEKVIAKGGKVIKIGKMINPNMACGEFIGLVKFSEHGAMILKKVYDQVKKKYADKPFHTASSLEKAYITDMIQELIDRGHTVSAIDTKSGWLEIDTVEDFNIAKTVLN